MKIICTQENLIKALGIAAHIAGKNVSLPILNNILIKAKDGIFTIISTNLDIGIKTIVRGKIEEEGELTAQARLFNDYVAMLSAGNIELSKKDNDLKIKTNNQETVIKGQETEEFPIVPEVDSINFVEIEVGELKNALNEILFSASYEEIRPELSGVLMVIKDNELTLAATDSYRLAEKVIQLGKEKIENLRKIVPLRVLQEVARILEEGTEKIRLSFNENQVVFKYKETIIISRLIEGNYPDYKEIIPSSFKTKVKIDKNDFIKVVKTASLFSKTGINDILLEFNQKGKKATVSAVNAQLGENKSELEIEIEGESNSVVFNYKYLLDGLQNMSGKKIIMEMTGSDTPVLLKPENIKGYLYLIMPIRK